MFAYRRKRENNNKSKELYNHFLIILFISLTLSSCNYKSNDSNISQGLIEYDINYIEQANKKIPLQLMPKTMDLLFNKNFSQYSIEDRLGLFSIKNIINFKLNKHITLVKIFDKKYVYYGLPGEAPILFEPFEKMKVDYTKDTIKLAGMLCYKATISTQDSAKLTFDIYYTKSIDIDFPNKNTPYQSINGMLLSFRLQLKSLNMQLKAKNFKHKLVEDKDFDVSDEYKSISRKQMEDIITTILP
jgi:hypothetical protein